MTTGRRVLAFLALRDPGDRVAVIEPGYPCYRNDLEALGIDVVGLPVDIADQCKLDHRTTRRASPARRPGARQPEQPGRAPCSPTTSCKRSPAGPTSTRSASHRRSSPHHLDRPRATTALAHSANVVVFNSFSKYFSMTGWRLGWIVAPLDLIAPSSGWRRT
ncbi:MAG: aminotransferase class I/II-fold pyridoxal phosphate-dependent enzyme [Acidimicrobiales bacterium]